VQPSQKERAIGAVRCKKQGRLLQHLGSGVTREEQGGTSAPGGAFWGRQIEVGMLSNNYELSNVNGCN